MKVYSIFDLSAVTAHLPRGRDNRDVSITADVLPVTWPDVLHRLSHKGVSGTRARAVGRTFEYGFALCERRFLAEPADWQQRLKNAGA
jgi:hypothetical protein